MWTLAKTMTRIAGRSIMKNTVRNIPGVEVILVVLNQTLREGERSDRTDGRNTILQTMRRNVGVAITDLPSIDLNVPTGGGIPVNPRTMIVPIVSRLSQEDATIDPPIAGPNARTERGPQVIPRAKTMRLGAVSVGLLIASPNVLTERGLQVIPRTIVIVLTAGGDETIDPLTINLNVLIDGEARVSRKMMIITVSNVGQLPQGDVIIDPRNINRNIRATGSTPNSLKIAKVIDDGIIDLAIERRKNREEKGPRVIRPTTAIVNQLPRVVTIIIIIWNNILMMKKSRSLAAMTISRRINPGVRREIRVVKRTQIIPQIAITL